MKPPVSAGWNRPTLHIYNVYLKRFVFFQCSLHNMLLCGLNFDQKLIEFDVAVTEDNGSNIASSFDGNLSAPN